MRDFSNIVLAPNRPVVFLDLCGVVGDLWVRRKEARYVVPHLPKDVLKHRRGGIPGDTIYKPAWDLLKAILLTHNAQVIFVTSWVGYFIDKDHPDIVRLREFFEFEDFIGSLYTGGGSGRGETVRQFVEQRQLADWVVVDDSRDQMYDEFFDNLHFVHPHGAFGFGMREAAHLQYLLSKDKNEWADHTFNITR